MTRLDDQDHEAIRGRQILILLLIALTMRLGWVVCRYGLMGSESGLHYPDEEAYWQVARSWAAGCGLVDEFGFRATYMPAYPAFLAMFADHLRPFLWIRITQAILAATVAPLTFILARVFLGRISVFSSKDKEAVPDHVDRDQAALLAGLLAAFDPFLVFFSGLLLTEALFAVVLVAVMILLLVIISSPRGRQVLLSVSLGVTLWLAIMLRPSAYILVLLIPATILGACQFKHKRLLVAVIVPLVVMIGLVPWAVRNQRTIGEVRWLTTRGGISLYDGFHPGATGESDLAHTKTMPEVAHLNETEWDAFFHDRAVAWIRENPGAAVVLAVRKVARTWSPVPNVAPYRSGSMAWISALWMTAILGFGAVGYWCCRKKRIEVFPLLLPVLAFTLLHAVYVGSIRYRVPVMPMIYVLTALGMCVFLTCLKTKARERSRILP